jgi:hypothetical protein
MRAIGVPASRVRHAGLNAPHRWLVGLVLVTAVLGLQGCLFETSRAVFGTADAVTPPGLHESYRIEAATEDGESSEPIYLRLQAEAEARYRAALYERSDDGAGSAWRIETYVIRFVPLDGGWYIWDAAEPQADSEGTHWYGLAQFEGEACRFVIELGDEAAADLERRAAQHGLRLKHGLGPIALDGDLSPAALKHFLLDVRDAWAARARLGACIAADLPAVIDGGGAAGGRDATKPQTSLGAEAAVRRVARYRLS